MTIRGHFDGRTVVLDEPASLVVGQEVRIVVEDSIGGESKVIVEPAFTPFVDLTATLMNGDQWDESAALHVDSLDAVPCDFVRHPGSAAGQIKMAEDFSATPQEFEEYL
jgi:hypothetical protein